LKNSKKIKIGPKRAGDKEVVNSTKRSRKVKKIIRKTKNKVVGKKIPKAKKVKISTPKPKINALKPSTTSKISRLISSNLKSIRSQPYSTVHERNLNLLIEAEKEEELLDHDSEESLFEDSILLKKESMPKKKKPSKLKNRFRNKYKKFQSKGAMEEEELQVRNKERISEFWTKKDLKAYKDSANVS
jgi:hypothetical protein